MTAVYRSMNTQAAKTALATAIIFLLLAAANEAIAATLTVRVRGVTSHSGVLRACLWNAPNGFPDCGHHAPVAGTSGPAVEGAELRFENIPLGVYAISLMQDLDNDGHLRTNLFGIPKEPVGLSNNPPLIRIPPPSWEDVKFSVSRDTNIDINLKNLR